MSWYIQSMLLKRLQMLESLKSLPDELRSLYNHLIAVNEGKQRPRPLSPVEEDFISKFIKI